MKLRIPRSLLLSLALSLIAREPLLAEEREAPADLESRIVSIYESHFPAMLEVSSDGTKLLMKEARQGKFELSALEPTSKSRAVLDVSIESQLGPRWSHDGKKVAFTIAEGGGRLAQVRIADLTQKEVTSLANPLPGLTGLSWSADDGAIAFAAQRERQQTLGVIDVDSAVVTFIETLAPEGGYSWSPSSRRLAYVPRAEPQSVRVVDLDSGTQQSVPLSADISALEWSSDSAFLLVAARPDGSEYPNLVRIDLSSQVARNLPVLVEGEVGEIHAVGTTFVYSEQRRGARTVFSLGPKLQQKIPLTPGAEQASVVGVARNPDRLFIVESKRHGMELELSVLQAATQKRQTLHRVSSGLRERISMQQLRPPVGGARATEANLWQASPRRRDPRRLILMVHGGPKLNYLPIWRPELNVLLSFDIDVLQLNYGGSSGFGARYAAQLPTAVNDIVASVEYAEKTLGYKSQEIFLLGDSYGAGLVLDATERVGERIGGVILFSFLGNTKGHGRKVAKTLVFHGANDPVADPDLALKALQTYWEVDDLEPLWWRRVEGEGHSFRKIGAWATTLAEIIRMVQ